MEKRTFIVRGTRNGAIVFEELKHSRGAVRDFAERCLLNNCIVEIEEVTEVIGWVATDMANLEASVLVPMFGAQ